MPVVLAWGLDISLYRILTAFLAIVYGLYDGSHQGKTGLAIPRYLGLILGVFE